MNLAGARERAATALAQSFWDNPVVVKEFRSRMRGWKAFVVMGAYCLLMSVVLLIAYYITAQDYQQSGRGYAHAALGGTLFSALTWAQTILLTLIVPALSSTSLTHELEKKTIEMLALSPLSAGRIVIGKQSADFIYALMLLMCSVPLAGITLMLGGISPAEIQITYLLLAAWTFLLTCSGIMFSSLTKKSAVASGNNFGLSLLYFISTASGGGAFLYMLRAGYTGSAMPYQPTMLLNPGCAPYAALQSATVCGIHVPLALVAFTVHVSYGILFLLIASSHVLYKPVERALPIRLLLLGLTIYLTWLGVGCGPGLYSKTAVLSAGITLLVEAMIFAAIFATGVVQKPAELPMFKYALSARRMFKSDIGGAIGFVTLWTAVTYICYGLTSCFASGPSAMSFAVRGMSRVSSAWKAEPGLWTCYWRMGVSVLAITAAMTAVGVLASSLMRRRNSAASLLVLFALVAFAGYGIVMALSAFGPPYHPGNAAKQLMALWPLTPMLTLARSLPAEQLPSWSRYAWIITSVVYLAIGAAALALAGRVCRKSTVPVED